MRINKLLRDWGGAGVPPGNDLGFLITGYELYVLNNYVDVSFDPDVYAAEGGALLASDLQIYGFAANGGTALTITISSITKTSGGALAGGENTVRVNLSISGGDPTGVETFEIRPSSAEVYKSSADVYCEATDTTEAITLYGALDPMYQGGIEYFLANAIDIPPLAQRLIDNQIFVGARADGWLTLCDMIYLTTSTAECNRFEFVSGTYLGTYSGTVAVTRYIGQRAATGGRFNTFWIPDTGVNFLQDSASLIAVIGNNDADAGAIAGARGNASGANYGRTKLTPRSNTNTTTTVTNTNTSSNNITVSSVLNSAGVYHLSRAASNDEKLYKNGVEVGSSAAASSTRSNKQLFAHCENNNGGATGSDISHDLMALITASDLRSKVTEVSDNLSAWRTSSLAQSPTYSGKLYSWIGQSNMGRSQSLSNLSPANAAIYNNGPISIANGYDANFYIWSNNNWVLLNPGSNGYTYNSDQFSPLFSFAVAECAKYPGEDLFCVFSVLGGTSLAVDWLPPSGARYTGYRTSYLNAISQLSVTAYMPVYWGQGEKDSQTLAYANAYEANELTMINAIKGFSGHVDFVVMQVNDGIIISPDYLATVRLAKTDNLADLDYGTSGALVSVDDLPVVDDFHLSADDAVIFGQRMSAAYP